MVFIRRENEIARDGVARVWDDDNLRMRRGSRSAFAWSEDLALSILNSERLRTFRVSAGTDSASTCDSIMDFNFRMCFFFKWKMSCMCARDRLRCIVPSRIQFHAFSGAWRSYRYRNTVTNLRGGRKCFRRGRGRCFLSGNAFLSFFFFLFSSGGLGGRRVRREWKWMPISADN